MLISGSPLISTATLTNNFGPQLNGTNLTCSSTTSKQVQPEERDYAVLILEGTQIIHGMLLFDTLQCRRRPSNIGKREETVSTDGQLSISYLPDK